jgi:hypothetical protein
MQYQGSVVVGGVPLFVTGAQANLARQPIVPDIVWGSGWNVNFATGHFDPTFSVSFPWFQSYGSGFVAGCIGENTAGTGPRNAFRTANLFNGGVNVFYPNVKCASLSFSANAMGNDALTCSATFSGKDEVTISTTNPGPTAPPSNVDGQTPVPAYLMQTNAVIGATAIPSNLITEFSLQINNNPFKLYTLNGSEVPSDIQLGLVMVEGSFTYYSGGLGTAPLAKTGSLTIVGGGLNFNIASLLYIGDANDLSGPNSKPMRQLQFRGMGTASQPPIIST